jgi:hypothetical protein
MTPTKSHSWFGRFAKWTFRVTGSPAAFGIALITVVAWAASGPPNRFLGHMAARDQWIGVGNGERHPLPPNPVCGFPATGSPVSCFRIGIGAPLDGPHTS